MIFSIDIGFEQDYTNIINSKRALDIAEAFGISLNKKLFKIINNLEIDIKAGDIVYITGESGAGKSLLLKALVKHISRYESVFGKVIVERDINIDDDELLIDSIGRDTEDAIRLLSMVGLNDAYIFLRRYKELSDGQKYRYRIAKILSSNNGKCTLVFDEFCSLLDRDTAKVVAYLLAKIARTNKYTLLLATSHDDLEHDLKPNVIIHKSYGSNISVTYNANNIDNSNYNEHKFKCSILDRVRIEKGSIKDWQALEEFHYRSGKPFGIKHVFKAVMDHNTIVGVIVYSIPPLSCKGRNIALNRVVSAEEVNRDFITISRVVVLPKFRGIGLATLLVKSTMPLVGKKYVESVAVMGKYNPFFIKAGMREIVYEPDSKYILALKELEMNGFNPVLAASKEYCYNMLESMNYDKLANIINTVSKIRFAVKNAIGRSREYSTDVLYDKYILAKAISNIALLAEKKYYYIWHNSNIN
jgi:ABC-type ATPase with predicted acetyltransferase domain